MMKQPVLFVFCIMVIYSSCTKTMDNVHFHGRITVDCGHQSAANVKILINRRYYKGEEEHSDSIGGTITDNDGYYSLVVDVRQKGDFITYHMHALSIDTSRYHVFFCDSVYREENKDIEMNCQGHPLKPYGFHIKNISPFNTGDVFNSLIIIIPYQYGGDYKDTIVTNLVGTNVDTTVYYLNSTQVNYKFSFTKNGVLTTRPDTIILNPNCLDTLNINVFY